MNEKKTKHGCDVFVLFWQNDGKIPTVFVFEPTAEKMFNFTFSNGCTRDNLIGLFKYFDVRMLESDWFLNLDARVSISECLLP